ncbi:MAG: glycosyltransferase [Myxococcales bacterium]|nr:glycosyltransferase [Myxococcales bacterium]
MTVRCRFVRDESPGEAAFVERVAIAIPAYNEAPHLPELLARCRGVQPAVIVVVDDASTDDTRRVLAEERERAPADPPLVVLRNPRNLGKQGSVRRALRALAAWDLDAVALIDGDGQHDPAELPRLAAHLVEADVVVGARVAVDMPPQRRLSNRLVNLGFRSIAGADFVDIQSGLRLYRKRAADVLAAHLGVEGAYGLEYESLVVLALDARDRGVDLRVVAAPISCAYGRATSWIRPRDVWQLGVGTVRQAARLRRARLAPPTAAGRRWRARAMTVEIHDVSPATRVEVERLRAELEAIGVDRGTLLVVPRYEDASGVVWDLRDDAVLGEWLRARCREGWEVVQHGLTHRASGPPPADPLAAWWRDRVARGQDEFAELSEGEARARLLEGRAILRACGLSADGFVAPVWRQSPGTRRALQALDFRFTAGLGHVRRLSGDTRPFRCPALTFAAGDPLVDLGKRAAMLGAEVGAVARPLLRVALHPEDLGHPGLLEHVLGRIRGLLRHRRLVTYAEWLAEQPAAGGDGAWRAA